MSLDEYERAASRAAGELEAVERDAAIAIACRGSGNPAILAWLAEAAGVDSTTRLVDIGGGLGGPAAWLTDRYGCTVVVADPVVAAARAASDVFGLGAVAAAGDALPFGRGSFDLALLLGVLSVVDSIPEVLAEARRLVPALASITYVSTGPEVVRCGGSRFPTRRLLDEAFRTTGWDVSAGPATPSLPPPPAWQVETGDGDDPDELAVARAIADGRIQPAVVVARRS